MTKKILLISISILILTVVLSACSDGDPGPQGKDGSNGTPGAPGADGIPGTDGTGMEGALKNGNIVVFLDGKRPDGISFKDTINFRFCPSILKNSSALESDGVNTAFTLQRYYGIDYVENAFINMYYAFYKDENTSDTVNYFEIHLFAFPSFSDHTYFRIDDQYSSADCIAPAIKAYALNSSANEVSYQFTLTVPANNNATGYDLNVSGVVDAIVYEQITASNGRKSLRTAPLSKIENKKAIMQRGDR